MKNKFIWMIFLIVLAPRCNAISSVRSAIATLQKYISHFKAKSPEPFCTIERMAKQSAKGIMGGFAGSGIGFPISVAYGRETKVQDEPVVYSTLNHGGKGIMYGSLTGAYLLGGGWGLATWIASALGLGIYLGNKAQNK